MKTNVRFEMTAYCNDSEDASCAFFEKCPIFGNCRHSESGDGFAYCFNDNAANAQKEIDNKGEVKK